MRDKTIIFCFPLFRCPDYLVHKKNGAGYPNLLPTKGRGPKGRKTKKKFFFYRRRHKRVKKKKGGHHKRKKLAQPMPKIKRDKFQHVFLFSANFTLTRHTRKSFLPK